MDSQCSNNLCIMSHARGLHMLWLPTRLQTACSWVKWTPSNKVNKSQIMSTLLQFCIFFGFSSLILSQKEKDPKSNTLSPAGMTKLIKSENPESYPMVECSINNFIVIIQTRFVISSFPLLLICNLSYSVQIGRHLVKKDFSISFMIATMTKPHYFAPSIIF